MRKKISSELTFLYKLSWIGFLIGIIIILFVTDLTTLGKIIYSLAFASGAFILFSISSELKDVEIDDCHLYVTDRRGTIQIPFLMIKNIRESFPNIFQKNVIIIELKVETKFSSTVKFIPYFWLGQPIFQHPLVSKLKQLADIEEDS